MKTETRKIRKVLFAGLIFPALIIGVLVRSRPAQQAALADGTVLRLTGVKVGFTNKFKHGSGLEKLLGDLIPANGWHFGRLALKRRTRMDWHSYSDATALTMEFQLAGASNALAQSQLI